MSTRELESVAMTQWLSVPSLVIPQSQFSRVIASNIVYMHISKWSSVSFRNEQEIWHVINWRITCALRDIFHLLLLCLKAQRKVQTTLTS